MYIDDGGGHWCSWVSRNMTSWHRMNSLVEVYSQFWRFITSNLHRQIGPSMAKALKIWKSFVQIFQIIVTNIRRMPGTRLHIGRKTSILCISSKNPPHDETLLASILNAVQISHHATPLRWRWLLLVIGAVDRQNTGNSHGWDVIPCTKHIIYS